MGADSLRSDMESKPSDAPGLKKAVIEAIGKAVSYGKGAFADVSSRSIERLEYRLYDEALETGTKRISYRDIKRIEKSKRGFRIVSGTGGAFIKPYAWLVVSGAKVPIGWERNGMEVPFETLVEEIAARAHTHIQSAS